MTTTTPLDDGRMVFRSSTKKASPEMPKNGMPAMPTTTITGAAEETSHTDRPTVTKANAQKQAAMDTTLIKDAAADAEITIEFPKYPEVLAMYFEIIVAALIIILIIVASSLSAVFVSVILLYEFSPYIKELVFTVVSLVFLVPMAREMTEFCHHFRELWQETEDQWLANV